MHIRNHGGGCCGIQHISGFGACTPAEQAVLRSLVSNSRNTLLEVVLKTNQAQQWGDTLATLGFKHVTTFVNGNTSNTLHVFHKRGERDITPRRDFSFKPIEGGIKEPFRLREGQLARVNSPRSKFHGLLVKITSIGSQWNPRVSFYVEIPGAPALVRGSLAPSSFEDPEKK